MAHNVTTIDVVYLLRDPCSNNQVIRKWVAWIAKLQVSHSKDQVPTNCKDMHNLAHRLVCKSCLIVTAETQIALLPKSQSLPKDEPKESDISESTLAWITIFYNSLDLEV